MITLGFGKFLTLWRYNGIPVCIGSKLITPRRLVWWWPVNWVAVVVALPVAIWNTCKHK